MLPFFFNQLGMVQFTSLEEFYARKNTIAHGTQF
jgi:hypothetical protein